MSASELEADLAVLDAQVRDLEAAVLERDERIAELVEQVTALEGQLKESASLAQAGGVNAAFWKSVGKGAIVGVADLIVRPPGLIIKGASLVQVGERQFVNLPSHEWVDLSGKKHYEDIIGFTDPEFAKRFKAAAHAAIRRLIQNPAQQPLPLAAAVREKLGQTGDKP